MKKEIKFYDLGFQVGWLHCDFLSSNPFIFVNVINKHDPYQDQESEKIGFNQISKTQKKFKLSK